MANTQQPPQAPYRNAASGNVFYCSYPEGTGPFKKGFTTDHIVAQLHGEYSALFFWPDLDKWREEVNADGGSVTDMERLREAPIEGGKIVSKYWYRVSKGFYDYLMRTNPRAREHFTATRWSDENPYTEHKYVFDIPATNANIHAPDPNAGAST